MTIAHTMLATVCATNGAKLAPIGSAEKIAFHKWPRCALIRTPYSRPSSALIDIW